MATHPVGGGKKKKKASSEERLACPACSRDFGLDKGWAFRGLRDHLMNSQDAVHAEWREAHPEGLERESEEEDITLWHVLREWPELGCEQTPAPQRDGGRSGEAEGGTIRFCNRLDRGTSGIVVVAASAGLADQVQEQWAQTRKEYLVLVRGATEQRFTVCRPLTDRTTKQKVAPLRDATTAFELVRTYAAGQLSLLRASLVQGGRTHQIRRHLSSVAHQVVGDHQHGKSRINALLEQEYGLPRRFRFKTGPPFARLLAASSSDRIVWLRATLHTPAQPKAAGRAFRSLGFEASEAGQPRRRCLSCQTPPRRLFLHAERLQIRHPASGKQLDVRDPLPRDLARFLERLPP